MLTLKNICEKYFILDISKHTVNNLIQHTILFELRKTNPEALNTPTIGLHKAYFLNSDKENIMSTFGVDYDEFEYEIRKASIINLDHKVRSDTFNLFITWLLHSLYTSKLTAKLRYDAMISAAKMMHYRFFTGLLSNGFRYTANETVMNYTINNLSGKFDITNKNTSTWKLLITDKSDRLVNGTSIHAKTIKTFVDDEKVMYLITDVQSRIRSTFRRIYSEYKDNLAKGNSLDAFTTVTANPDGEKVIQGVINSLPSAINKVTAAVVNNSKIIDSSLIKVVVAMNKNIRHDMFREFLLQFSNNAIQQNKDHEDDTTYKENNIVLLLGYRILVHDIIQKTYRRLLLRKVDITKPLVILDAAHKIYTNSRMNDKDLLSIKESISKLVDKLTYVKRDQTRTGLKIGVILYIILLATKYNK